MMSHMSKGLLVVILFAMARISLALPLLPCTGQPLPAYPSLGEPPNTDIWFHQSDKTWIPAPCSQWSEKPYSVLLALAGRFYFAGDVNQLAARLGRVSQHKKIKYWSVSSNRWQPLIRESLALTSENKSLVRDDFNGDELVPGQPFYLWQRESTFAGEMVYRLRVLERTPTRLLVDSSNVNRVWFFIFPILGIGEYQYLHFIEKESPGIWRYYGLLRIGGSWNPYGKGFEASYINRAVALYRYLAGIPTDLEPPVAP